jgi:hypothetical protein
MNPTDLAGLSRRGCVRFAVACASHIPQEAAGLRVLDAARAWLRRPCKQHADEAHAAADYVKYAAYAARCAQEAAGLQALDAARERLAKAAGTAATTTHVADAVAAVADALYTVSRGATAAERQWQQRALAIIRLGDAR